MTLKFSRDRAHGIPPPDSPDPLPTVRHPFPLAARSLAQHRAFPPPPSPPAATPLVARVGVSFSRGGFKGVAYRSITLSLTCAPTPHATPRFPPLVPCPFPLLSPPPGPTRGSSAEFASDKSIRRRPPSPPSYTVCVCVCNTGSFSKWRRISPSYPPRLPITRPKSNVLCAAVRKRNRYAKTI